jgi:simple sugar transport system ATP-binding protein
LLCGQLQPDSGEILIANEQIKLKSAAEAQRHGISLVHQHFTLVPAFTVTENLALPFAARSNFVIDTKILAERAQRIANNLGWSVDPNKRVSDLSVGQQQRIEIIKALSAGSSVVMFDEPTSTMTPETVEELFRVMRDLRNSNLAVVLIAHKLEEVLAVADFVSVLRKGRVFVADIPIGSTTQKELAEWMVGDVPDVQKQQSKTPEHSLVLSISHMTVKGHSESRLVDDVSFEVRQGEVFGIGGVDGNGQIELAEAIAGVRRFDAGSVKWSGDDLRIGFIPQDRRRDGLALHMTVSENMLIDGHRDRTIQMLGFLLPHRVANWSWKLIRDFDIRAESPSVAVASLSGGNQQKVIVSRVLSQDPNVIIAMGPTRGLDIKATRFVHEQLLAARDRGAAVILFTNDIDELTLLADRIGIMSSGKLLRDGKVAEMIGGIE